MSATEKLRKVMALPEVVQNVELAEKLKNIYEDYSELVDKNYKLTQKLENMEKISSIKKLAKKYNGYYFLDDEKYADGSKIPFCLNCLYENDLQIPMTYGVVKSGWVDLHSGSTMIPSTYGITCKKCGAKLAVSDKIKGVNNG